MFQIILGGIIAIALYIYIHKRENPQLYIGQKIYYYIHDDTKYYAGRIMAIIKYTKEEDITNPASTLRILSDSERKIKKSKFSLVEIQPIIGGSRLCLPEQNIKLNLE